MPTFNALFLGLPFGKAGKRHSFWFFEMLVGWEQFPMSVGPSSLLGNCWLALWPQCHPTTQSWNMEIMSWRRRNRYTATEGQYSSSSAFRTLWPVCSWVFLIQEFWRYCIVWQLTKKCLKMLQDTPTRTFNNGSMLNSKVDHPRTVKISRKRRIPGSIVYCSDRLPFAIRVLTLAKHTCTKSASSHKRNGDFGFDAKFTQKSKPNLADQSGAKIRHFHVRFDW